jgi:LacI family transcriptional regulator
LPAGPGADRLLGYRAALSDWSVEVDEDLIVEGAFEYGSGRRAAALLLASGVHYTAIFAHNDLMAIGAMAALKHASLRVPEEVAVIGYDGTEIAALYDPPLTTMAQRTYDLGACAMTVLADRIEGIERTPAPATLDSELIVRRSTMGGLEDERRCGPNAAEAPWLNWRSLGAGVAPPTRAASISYAPEGPRL